MQQPSKELVGMDGESPLVKASKGHHVAFGKRRLILIARQPPLLGGGQWAKEATVNEAL